MSAVLEVSEGLSVDGQIFEPPQQSRDNEEPRYITILGSFIEPITAQERAWTRFGGIEISNPCLRYVKHFVRKGRITPVLKDTFEWMSVDIWEKATGKDASYFQRPIPANYQAPTDAYGNPSKIAPLMGKIALPGIQIEQIINGSANIFKGRERRGVVEHKSLKGISYNPQPLGDGIIADAQIWQIQKAIFPTWPVLPILIDETEEILEAAKAHTSLRPIVDEMLTSLAQFRDFARATVDQTHYTMRESAAKSNVGYIPRYTDLDFVLLEQLGMARQDREIRQEPKQVSASDPELRDALKQLVQLQIEEKQANLERLKRVDEVAPITESTMAASVIRNDTPEHQEQMSEAMADVEPEDTVHECECGEKFPKAQGLRLHQTRYCKLMKGAEE